MAAHHARALRQAEKDFEEASKSGRLGEAEGAARRGITAAGGVRETRDGKGIRPDLLVREGLGGDKGGRGLEKRLGEVRGLLEAKSMAFCASNYGDKTTWGKRGDGKTWAERVADRCVRALCCSSSPVPSSPRPLPTTRRRTIACPASPASGEWDRTSRW